MRRLYPTAADLPDAASLEDEYLVQEDRHVRANFVVSLDGRVEVGGRSSGLGGPADRAAFMTMRAVTDAILVGAGTVRDENYGPVQLDPGATERRLRRRQAGLPVLAIVSNRAELSPSARVFSGSSRPLLLTSAAAGTARADLREVAEVLVCGEEQVDLPRALDALNARGLGRVLCEGGPTLLHALLTAHLLDQLCYTSAPVLVGSGRRELLGGVPLPTPIALRLTAILEGDGMILSRYSCGGQP
jgi:riboflavin-specific deaminase-like protein